MKLRYLLDTSVYSQPLRNRPAEGVLDHWRRIGDGVCGVSRVTVAEVEYGLHLEGNATRWAKYDALLKGRLMESETDDRVWRQFSRMKARQQQLGEPVADLDLLIAATAWVQDGIVATLNHRDFSRVEGIRWEDWS